MSRFHVQLLFRGPTIASLYTSSCTGLIHGQRLGSPLCYPPLPILLHKGGPLADQPSHWRPVVLLNTMNQLVTYNYIVKERLTELVEHGGILTQAQGGFRQDKSTDINACKLYSLTKKAQRLKRRFLRVDIDFKSAFNSMSQSSLWVISDAYNIPDIDL